MNSAIRRVVVRFSLPVEGHMRQLTVLLQE